MKVAKQIGRENKASPKLQKERLIRELREISCSQKKKEKFINMV